MARACWRITDGRGEAIGVPPAAPALAAVVFAATGARLRAVPFRKAVWFVWATSPFGSRAGPGMRPTGCRDTAPLPAFPRPGPGCLLSLQLVTRGLRSVVACHSAPSSWPKYSGGVARNGRRGQRPLARRRCARGARLIAGSGAG
ncbi:hypothetical protein DLJ49_17575 [Rhodovulum sp. 12E13]|nr:hypothetical protein DLJ49_17575 [Rhodovulum sp. 12E13]